MTKVTAQGIEPDPNPPEVEEKLKELAELKRLVSVLGRGFTYDRLAVDLPADIHGEWVHESEVSAMKVIGFELDKKYAVGQSTETRADGAAKVLDVVFMTCPKRHHELIQKAKDIIKERRQGDPRKPHREITMDDLNLDLGRGSSIKSTITDRTVDATELRSILRTMQDEGGVMDLSPSVEGGMVTQLLDFSGKVLEAEQPKT